LASPDVPVVSLSLVPLSALLLLMFLLLLMSLPFLPSPTAADAFLLPVLPTYLTSPLLLVALLVVSDFVGYLL
jgi:hypothetical protein